MHIGDLTWAGVTTNPEYAHKFIKSLAEGYRPVLAKLFPRESEAEVTVRAYKKACEFVRLLAGDGHGSMLADANRGWRFVVRAGEEALKVYEKG